jgi:hypothetical protein
MARVVAADKNVVDGKVALTIGSWPNNLDWRARKHAAARSQGRVAECAEPQAQDQRQFDKVRIGSSATTH